MNPYQMSQLITGKHADLVADASRQRLGRQVRSARRAAPRTGPARPPIRSPRLAAWLRTLVAA
jgi:hypothetical protein